MFAILAALAAGVGYILDVSATTTARWDSPTALLLAAVTLLALHLAGVGTSWTRRPPQ